MYIKFIHFRVGLIEWVKKTMPLKDFIQLSDPEKKSL